MSWLVGALSPVSHRGLHQGWSVYDREWLSVRVCVCVCVCVCVFACCVLCPVSLTLSE